MHKCPDCGLKKLPMHGSMYDEKMRCTKCHNKHSRARLKKDTMSIKPIDFEKEYKNHKRCEDPELQECIYCGWKDCPHHEPLHYHHDGCPACIEDDELE